MKARRLLLLVALLSVAALVAPPAASSQQQDAIPEQWRDKAIDFGDGYKAIPLSAPQPSWYTPDLHREVMAAAEHGEGVALPEAARAEYEASGLLFTGIRPGSWMIAPSGCTMMWVFGGTTGTLGSATESGEPDNEEKGNGGGNGKGGGNGNGKGGGNDGRGNGKGGGNDGGGGGTGSGVYIGTAGHCAEVGDEVVIVAAPGILMNIGRTVKSVDGGLGKDYAFVEIRPAMVQYVNPSMAHVGGPTGAEAPLFGDPVAHSGHGIVIGTGGTPRPGLVTYDEGENGAAYGWDGAAIFGDSGSPVRHAGGAAAGNLTHLVVNRRWLPAFIGGTTIQKIVAAAPAPLATAPPLPDPLW